MTATTYPECKAVETWQHGEVTCSLVLVAPGYATIGQSKWHCGYARFAEDPFGHGWERGESDGLIGYVPVHGGVSYKRHDDAGFVVGFDCNHYMDEHNGLLWSIEWLTKETERMADGVILARDGGFSKRWCDATTDDERSSVAEAYARACAEKFGQDCEVGMMTALRLMVGGAA